MAEKLAIFIKGQSGGSKKKPNKPNINEIGSR